jgi:KDO2-lipid IV(A) lauroyltransferase
MYYVAGYRKKVVRRNLGRSFPDKSQRELREMEQKFYHRFSDTLVEIVYGYRASAEEMRERVVFENVNLIDDLALRTRGVIVWMGHVGNWEWIAELNRHFADPAMVQYNVYRQLKNPQADKMIIELRGKRGGECVEKNQLLRKLVALRRSPHPYVLGMLSDQKPSKRSSYVWTQFLQQETAFLDGSEVLAKKFGLSAVYAHITSPKRGYYHVRFELITDNAQAMPPEWMTKRYAQLLEQNISAQPELWLWTHNRWKWGRTDLEG